MSFARKLAYRQGGGNPRCYVRDDKIKWIPAFEGTTERRAMKSCYQFYSDIPK